MKDCDGLRPSREGKRVRFDGDSRTVINGPFSGDLAAGDWLWDCFLLRKRFLGFSDAQILCRDHRKSRFEQSTPKAETL